jgi:CRISPR-associated endonuclease/helicase Cas3
VDYHFPKPDEKLDWKQLAQMLGGKSQALCVVNLRRHAAVLWEEVRNCVPDSEKNAVFHLSSSMCAQHRLDVLDRIRGLLAAGCP